MPTTEISPQERLSLPVRARRIVADGLRRSSGLRRFLQIGFVLGGVLLAGTSEVLSNSLDGSAKVIAQTLWFVGLTMAFIGGIALAALEQDADASLRLSLDAIDAANRTQEELTLRESELAQAGSHAEWLARLYALSIAHREIVEQTISKGAYDSDVFDAQVAALLDLLVADKETFFGIRDERWNFAVYSWDASVNELVCLACRRPHASEAEAAHRSWRVGEGHVGLAFERRREFVEADLADPETAKFFSTPSDKQRGYDEERYRSIASLPLLIGEDARGVLVATTDVPFRFKPGAEQEIVGRDPVEALRLTAATIAILSEVAHVQLRLPREDRSEEDASGGTGESR